MSPRLITPVRMALMALGLGLVGAWLFARAMALPLSHDEHQFVAAGRLLADFGLLPYRDFPYHHTPYLPFVYAAVFRLSEYSLLSARVVSVACALMICCLLFLLVQKPLEHLGPGIQMLLGAGGVVLFVSSPIVAYTSGRSWNHDLPALFALLAFALRLHAESRSKPGLFHFLSGASIGLAAGTRLSYATLFLPLLLSFWRAPAGQPRSRIRRNLGPFVLGAATSLAPLGVLTVLGPRGFIFGNAVYQILNTEYREVLLHWLGHELRGKLLFLQENVLVYPENTVLILGSMIVAFAALIAGVRRRTPVDLGIALSTGMALFLMAGSLAPTPLWYQYLYAPIPFVVAAAMLAGAKLTRIAVRPWAPMLALSVLIVGSTLFGSLDLAVLGELSSPQRWVPVRVHQMGVELRSLVPTGKVLTLGPIVPMEGGIETYKEFATGPFSWRVAHLLSAERRREYGVVSREDLAAYLGADPPAGLLTGFEAGNEGFERGEAGGVEEPLVDYARSHGYNPVVLQAGFLRNDLTLWVR